MDSQVRHDLEKNELAHWMGKGFGRVRPYLPHILVGLLVLAVAISAWFIFRGTSRPDIEPAWQDFAKTDVAGLNQILLDYPGSPVAAYAKYRLAWIQLDQGKTGIIDNRDEAIKSLHQASTLFSEVIDDSGDIGVLRPLALFGKAMALETSFQLDKAMGSYQQIIDEYPGDPFADIARRKLETLEQPETKAFYAALEAYRHDPTDALPTPVPPTDLFEGSSLPESSPPTEALPVPSPASESAPSPDASAPNSDAPTAPAEPTSSVPPPSSEPSATEPAVPETPAEEPKVETPPTEVPKPAAPSTPTPEPAPAAP